MKDNAMMNQIRIPLFLSFYALIFLAVPKYGNAFQLLSLALIVIQNASTFIGLKRNKFNSFKNSLTFLTLFLIAIVPLQSLANNFFNFELYYVQYSILFFAATFSIYIAVNTIEFRVILNNFLCAAVAITLTILVTSSDLLLQTLAITYDPENGLSRFAPYGLHPNLVGHIFGGFAVMFFCFMLYGKKLLHKILFTALLLISFLYCIAASSRGGFLAALLGIVTVYAIAVWQDKVRRKHLILFILLAFIVLFFTKGADKVASYLSSIFEYGSSDRGVGSGLTGRTEHWDKLFHTVFSSVAFILFGNGLRTGSVEVLGYDIDNSYLNLLYEMGLASTLLFVMLIIANTNKLKRALLHTPDVLKATAVGLLVFILCESVVARYLLSIGNPLSLFVVYCMLGVKNILKSPSHASVSTQTHYHQASQQYWVAQEGTRL